MALPTLSVTDSTNSTVIINTLPPAGQANSGNSLSVVLASDQSSLTVLLSNTGISNTPGQKSNSLSLPVVLDTSVETAPGTPGTLALSVQGNANGVPIPIYDAFQAPNTVVWTTATALNTTSTVNTSGYDTVIVTSVCNANVTGGGITFEVFDGATWLPVKAPTIIDYTTVSSVSLTASYSKGFQIPVAGFPQFRTRLSSVLTGTSASMNVVTIVSSAPDTSLVTVGLDPAQPLPAGTNLLGVVSANLFMNGTVVSTANPVPVFSRVAQVKITSLVVNTSAYVSGYNVGGLIMVASATDTTLEVLLSSLALSIKSVQTASFKVYIFDSNPSSTTFTDHAAVSINAADVPKLIGSYNLSNPDSNLGTHTIYNLEGITKPIAIASGNTIYAALITTGTPTFTSNTDIQALTFGFA